MLIRLDKVSLAFGSRPLLEAAELQVEAGERVCIVGRNGEGKSSLLKLVTREIHPDAGEVWIQPGARVASLQQDLAGDAAGHVYDIVAAALSDGALHDEDWRIEMQVREIIERLQLDAEADFADLSGGWRRRVLLARALVAEPHVLLLDEPTNHLDIEAIEWLENLMQTFPGALLFVSHDRAFINRIATRVVELDRGTLRSWPGNYDAYAKKKTEQLESEAIHNALFDKRLAQEEVWIRKGVEARRTRNEGRVRALYELREERRDRRERVGSVALEVQEGEKSGKKVFESEDAVVKFGDRTIISGLTTTILRGDRVGIVGPNGAGKSTLIRLLLGELEAASGRVERGTKLQVAYYDQQRAQLQLDRSVMENVADRGDHVIINGQPRHASGYLRDFLFRPEQLRTPASALSGGERNRLLLAKLFASPANLLVMDEPTNDLDIDTLELLEEMVADFSGTLLLVSHDRSFLDHVATELLVFTGEGRVQEFVGGYSDWVRYRDGRKARPAPARASANASGAAAATNAPGSTSGKRGGSPAAVPMPAAVVAPPVKPSPSKRKVSFKDQREFSLLPATIEKLEAEQTELTTRVNAPEFYNGPREQVQGALARMKSLQEEIEAAYLRWAELESVVADTRPE